MEPGIGKPSFLRNLLVRLLLFCVIFVCFRFAYVVIILGESCDSRDFCFFSMPEKVNAVVEKSTDAMISVKDSPLMNPNKVNDSWVTKDFEKASKFYHTIFQDLIDQGFLSPNSIALCVETVEGCDVYALKEIGVSDSIGISKKSFKHLVVSGLAIRQPFDDSTFDFVFSGGGMVEKSKSPVEFASEIGRTLKPDGYLVVHSGSTDTYSFNSLVDLFNCCTLVKSRDIENGIDNINMPMIREIVMRKQIFGHKVENLDGGSKNNCSVPGYKRELIRKAEPLITEEPKKPWITLKRNLQNIKYLASMVDISFKPRYVYVDVGSRSYGSSIVSWFKKQYPKQNKTFDIYAIEADKHFHDQYKSKKGVTLLPYAAWVRNESLFFEINQDPGDKAVVKGRGMGRIQPVQSSTGSTPSHVNEIQGFDFAEWLKSAATEKDFVVMKMDVEGTEFDLIPRLFETGAICLIDEIFLECHYNRWQKCCPGERSPKYEKTYGQCLDLFTSLRDSGVLVHQWW
ncbi:methyltransferase [Lithospermum erythrorhizon]|uniref:Methyltransferase n=1 Tax=Lithospermum erythrorhizon TaxID=34254 RepID=A0AAV3RXT0_LITER